MIRKSGLVASCLVAAMVIGSAEQAPPDVGTTFRSGVDVVRLDVSVLDRNRMPIRGLTAADFTVLEAGMPQPIVGFDAVDLPDQLRPRGSWMREVAPDVVTNRLDAQRVVVILLDDFGVPFEPSSVEFSKKIARAAIDQLGPADVAAVVYTLTRNEGQEFTTDRARLLAAVDRFSSSAPRMEVPARLSSSAESRSQMSPASSRPAPSGACYLNDCLRMALRNAAEILSAWPGARKTLVLISPAQRGASPQTLEGAIENSDLTRTFRAMQEANLNVYQFDPRGLEVNRRVDDDFGMFADSTGGRAITATNTPWELVPQMFRENSSYYVIGFRSTNVTRDGRFRRVTVRVSRPGAEVRTRSGYYAPQLERAAKPSKRPPPSTLDRAVAGGLPMGDLPVSLTVAPFAAAGLSGARATNKATLMVIAGLDAVDGGSDKDLVEVRTAAFRSDWKSAGSATQTLELSARSADERPHNDFASRLDLAPGRYEIRVAVNSAATGRTGSVYASVTIPDFSKEPIALSGVVLEHRTSMVRAGGDAIASLPVVPTSVRDFSSAERPTAFVRIYQGGKRPLAPVRVTARILNEEDRAVFEETSTIPAANFNAVRSTDYRLMLPLAGLDPGGYLLSIVAAAGPSSSQRDVRINVK
jgi:VWFA-related protein